jgi:hypothetical protein
LKFQLEQEKQSNRNLQKEIQEKHQSFEVLLRLIEKLTNWYNDLYLQNKQNNVHFEELFEMHKTEQQKKFELQFQQIKSDHDQWKNKFEEYLLTPLNTDHGQVEADRLRFLFLSHLSRFHCTKETHDYFHSTLDNENSFEQLV